jgi:hypothetical protein
MLGLSTSIRFSFCSLGEKRVISDSFTKQLIVCPQTFIANVCWLNIVAIHMVGKFFYFFEGVFVFGKRLGKRILKRLDYFWKRLRLIGDEWGFVWVGSENV